MNYSTTILLFRPKHININVDLNLENRNWLFTAAADRWQLVSGFGSAEFILLHVKETSK